MGCRRSLQLQHERAPPSEACWALLHVLIFTWGPSLPHLTHVPGGPRGARSGPLPLAMGAQAGQVRGEAGLPGC